MTRALKYLLLLCLSLPVWAATQMTFTGVVQAPSGALATSGYVEFDLTPQNQAIAYSVIGSGLLAPQTGRCGINSLGQIKNSALTGACTIWGNDVILPGNSLYKIIVAPGNRIINTINNVLLSGTTADISNLTLIAPTPVIGPTITASPLNSMTIAPSVDGAFTLGQPNKHYANTFTNSVTGNDINTPSTPATGEVGYFKANSGWCTLDSTGVERCIGAPPTPITCSTPGAVVIQSPAGTLYICDPGMISDGAGNLTLAGLLTALGVSTSGPGGVLDLQFQTPPTSVPAGHAYIFANSNTGLYDCFKNLLVDCFGGIQQVASGSSAMPTSSISAGGCTIVTTAATGVTTSSQIIPYVTVDVTGITGYAPSTSGGIYIDPPFPTTNNVNFKVCNNSSVPITPGALTVFWKVI